MYLKFLHTNNELEKLKDYPGDLQLWVPNIPVEKYCYLELEDQDLEAFLDHFMPEDVSEVAEGENELPNSLFSMSGNNGQRYRNFSIVRR